tara:strand:- start:700 stop:1134 length:435 start_codon:yes stop_codon:yes gene_type:complete
MNIINYINSKNKCHVFNLTLNKKILNQLNLINYPSSNKYERYSTNEFSNNDLVIFIISSNLIKDKSIFELTSNYNNVVIYVMDDTYIQSNETQCKNIFISYGYKYQGKTNSDKVSIFIYDIAEYKDNPDWLNNENWANPELWEK